VNYQKRLVLAGLILKRLKEYAAEAWAYYAECVEDIEVPTEEELAAAADYQALKRRINRITQYAQRLGKRQYEAQHNFSFLGRLRVTK
jgi:uncharacterized protein YciW